MNSLKTTAQGRTNCCSRLWLLARFLPLLILVLGASPAHANGVNTAILSGDIQYGTITTTGSDVYTFTCETSSCNIMVTIGETGTHDANFIPNIALTKPGGLGGGHTGARYRASLLAGSVAGGWSVTVTRQDSTHNTGGNYALTLSITTDDTSVTYPNNGTAMYPSTTYSGTIGTSAERDDMGIFDFGGNVGVTGTCTLTATGGTGMDPEIYVYKPDGTIESHGVTTTNISVTTGSMVAGDYTSSVRRLDGNDNTGTYTDSCTNIGAPGLGKSQGDHCPTCPGGDTVSVGPRPGDYEVGNTGGSTTGEPIDVATGNMYYKVTDYTTVGTNPLALTRSYNSMSYKLGIYPSMMGPNWRTNYDRYLRVISSSLASVERPDGRVISFALSGGTGTPDSDVDFKLTYSGSTYTLTNPNDVVETYTVTSGKGALSSIAWPNGYTQTMTYTSGVLTSVSDSYSRSLSFTYTGGVLTGVTTPDSATLTYGYTTVNSQQLLTSITYNTSPSTSQTYVYANTKLPFMLTSITDENGNTNAQWTYDGAGRATMSELAGGANEYQVSYDDATGNRTVTGPLGNAETYKFTSLQGLRKVNEIDRAANSPVALATRTFGYDSNGYLNSAYDWNGTQTTWTNNSHGQPTSMTEAVGKTVARTTTITYDSTWVHRPYTTTKTNVTIDDRYDATKGTLTSHTLKDTTGGSTNNQTHVWNYTYNTTGQMLTAQMPRTGTTVKNTYTYTGGALTSITDQLSHVTTINTYNGSGQPTQITDPNSVVTNLTYDNRNRLLTKSIVASPSNELTTITYFGSGQPDLITLPDSSTIDYDYDTAQRLTTITNTAGETINYTLNAMGEPTTTTIKDSGGTTKKSWTATYDVLGDMLTRVGSAGASQTTTYAYDKNQNRTSTTDANSKIWGQTWDELNRATKVTDPLNSTAIPTYNNLDYVTAQTDFSNYSTSFTRDGFGNAIAKSSPDTGSDSYTYDEDNNLTARTDARSVASAQTFDAVDRITAHTFTGYSGEAIAYTYDDTTSSNKGVDRLTGFTDESGSTAITYDNFGNITKEVRVIGGKTYTTSYSYDLANRLTEIIYPSGRYVDYTYNSSGYLTTVTTKPTSGGSVTTLASSITHKPFGPIASFTYGNSEVMTKTYDNNYWLSTLNTVFSGTYVQELSFGEDNAGNLTSITDTLASARSQTFTVDALNRLSTASGAYGSRTYTFTSNSNRLTRVGATTQTSTYTANTNLLASITDGTNTRHFTNSASGNMATDDRVMNGGLAVSNTYGGRDRLESMTVNSASLTFKINAIGERVSKATVSTTTHFMFDLAHHIIGEANGSTGANTGEYVWMEGQLLAQIDSSGNIVYVYSDQVNAPQKMANPSRTLVWDYEIEPFGETYATPTNTTPTNHRFPGQYADTEDSLSYNNNRDYDATLGRYIQHDPIGFGGGMNLFGYVGQNPTQWTDPMGLKVQECCRPANILLGMVQHCWLSTDTKSAGMGDSKECRGDVGNNFEYPYSTQVQVSNHSCETATSCTDVPNVDEACVNKQLDIGKDLGRFSLWNNCQTYASGVIAACPAQSTGPAPAGPIYGPPAPSHEVYGPPAPTTSPSK